MRVAFDVETYKVEEKSLYSDELQTLIFVIQKEQTFMLKIINVFFYIKHDSRRNKLSYEKKTLHFHVVQSQNSFVLHPSSLASFGFVCIIDSLSMIVRNGR